MLKKKPTPHNYDSIVCFSVNKTIVIPSPVSVILMWDKVVAPMFSAFTSFKSNLETNTEEQPFYFGG